jgi:hypothetical protein
MRLTIAIEMARRANALAAEQKTLALQPVTKAEMPPARPQSGFLAHLAATYLRLPQTREKRRAAPEQATRAYSAAASLAPRH